MRRNVLLSARLELCWISTSKAKNCHYQANKPQNQLVHLYCWFFLCFIADPTVFFFLFLWKPNLPSQLWASDDIAHRISVLCAECAFLRTSLWYKGSWCSRKPLQYSVHFYFKRLIHLPSSCKAPPLSPFRTIKATKFPTLAPLTAPNSPHRTQSQHETKTQTHLKCSWLDLSVPM